MSAIKAKDRSGFTIVELLIVIVVIGILAAIVIVAYNGVQVRARDAQRVNDIASIKKTLLLYDSIHGGVERTTTYGGNGSGGWNYSSGTNWLSFLEGQYGKMPVDPVNQGASTSAGDFNYHYYCYPAGSSGYTNHTVVLGYRPESNSARKTEVFTVNNCI